MIKHYKQWPTMGEFFAAVTRVVIAGRIMCKYDAMFLKKNDDTNIKYHSMLRKSEIYELFIKIPQSV